MEIRNASDWDHSAQDVLGENCILNYQSKKMSDSISTPASKERPELYFNSTMCMENNHEKEWCELMDRIFAIEDEYSSRKNSSACADCVENLNIQMPTHKSIPETRKSKSRISFTIVGTGLYQLPCSEQEKDSQDPSKSMNSSDHRNTFSPCRYRRVHFSEQVEVWEFETNEEEPSTEQSYPRSIGTCDFLG
jgi:hypothetical protein